MANSYIHEHINIDEIAEKLDTFAERKIRARKISGSFRRMGNNDKYLKICGCGTFLGFTSTNELYTANFCRDKLCPMCQWRRTRLLFGQLVSVCDSIGESKKFGNPVLITLTMRNEPILKLRNCIDTLLCAWRRLSNLSRFRKSFPGWYRTVEVTIEKKTLPSNQPTLDSDYDFSDLPSEIAKMGNVINCHPHVHILAFTSDDYFSSDSYVSQRELSSLWKRALGVRYQPVVDIRAVRADPVNFKKSVNEVVKYAVKSTDFEYMDSVALDTSLYFLDGALTSRRLVSFGGIMRDMHQLLNLTDVDNGALANTSSTIEIRREILQAMDFFRWCNESSKYIPDKVLHVTDIN